MSIKFILSSLTVVAGSLLMTAETNADMRARKATKEYFQVVDTSSSRIARVFTGEWVEVEAPNNGNIIIAGDTLPTDKLKITESKDKEDINLHKQAGFNSHLTVIDDSILRICQPDSTIEKIELLFFKDGKNFIRDSVRFDNDTVNYNLTKVDTTYYLHINVPNRIVEQYAITSLPAIITPPDNIQVNEPNDPEGLDMTKLFIVTGIAVLLIATVVVVFLYMRKRKSPQQGKNEEKGDTDRPESNENDSGTIGMNATLTPSNQRTDKTTNVTESQNPQEITDYKSAYNLLKSNYNKLKSECNRLQDDLHIANSDNQTLKYDNSKLRNDLDQQRRDYEDQISQKKREYTEKSAQKEREYKDLIKTEKAKANEEAENKYAKRLSDRENEINKLNDKIKNDQEEHIRQIKDIKDTEFKKQQEILDKLDSTSRTLSATQNNLRTMTADRDDKAARLETQITANKTFTTQFAPLGNGAVDYASKIDSLVNVKEQVMQACARLLDNPIEDRYDIYRLIANFESQVEDLSLDTTLYAPISLLANTGFVMRSNPLSSFATVSDNGKLKEGVQRHFYDQTKGLISALVVLNESMIGLPVITHNMVSKAFITRFVELRAELDKVCRDLGIIVETMHIGDEVGFKVDLVVENVDLDLPNPGTIVSLDNCIVYLEKDGRPADQRIHVKAQS